jgi:aminoglycoside phosphotransferase (APT) family kinase protein
MTSDGAGVPLAFTDEEVRALVDAINARHETSLRLLGRYRGGDGTGAYRIEEATGQTYVLKCARGEDASRAERAAAATGFLRARGYPAPEYVVVGRDGRTVYEVLTVLDGVPIGSIGQRWHYLEQALALNDLQADGPALGGSAWPEPVVDPVLHGGDGVCLIETMQSYSPATAALLDEVQELVRSNADGVPTDRHDIVHFDFHADNILATGERISGVMDWQPVSGDRVFDLFCLAWGERKWWPWSIVLPGLVERSGIAAIRVYAAYLTHSNVDWMVRFHRHRVESTIQSARELLDVVARL